MSNSYKALAVMLAYPDEEFRDAYDVAAGILDTDPSVPQKTFNQLKSLAVELERDDLLELQSRYVQLFDRTRSLSLNLYEHVHGESRDRGQAMVELHELYRQQGLELATRELPDHLPVFLDFLSRLSEPDAAALLGEAIHVIEAIGERLKKRKSIYAAVFDAIVALAKTSSDTAALNALLEIPEDDPDDLVALDKAWAEEPVTFGPGETGCPKASEIVSRFEEKLQ